MNQQEQNNNKENSSKKGYPEKELKIGYMKITQWVNTPENGGKLKSFSIQKNWKDKNEKWHNSDTIFLHEKDLIALKTCLEIAINSTYEMKEAKRQKNPLIKEIEQTLQDFYGNDEQRKIEFLGYVTNLLYNKPITDLKEIKGDIARDVYKKMLIELEKVKQAQQQQSDYTTNPNANINNTDDLPF